MTKSPIILYLCSHPDDFKPKVARHHVIHVSNCIPDASSAGGSANLGWDNFMVKYKLFPPVDVIFSEPINVDELAMTVRLIFHFRELKPEMTHGIIWKDAFLCNNPHVRDQDLVRTSRKRFINSFFKRLLNSNRAPKSERGG